jgi:hypothetical protein
VMVGGCEASSDGGMYSMPLSELGHCMARVVLDTLQIKGIGPREDLPANKRIYHAGAKEPCPTLPTPPSG